MQDQSSHTLLEPIPDLKHHTPGAVPTTFPQALSSRLGTNTRQDPAPKEAAESYPSRETKTNSYCVYGNSNNQAQLTPLLPLFNRSHTSYYTLLRIRAPLCQRNYITSSNQRRLKEKTRFGARHARNPAGQQKHCLTHTSPLLKRSI